jgi:TRAP-type C4-dicarboxylate transport system permease small subunit
MLPRRAQTVLRVVNVGVTALFAGLLVWYGWAYASASRQLYMVSDQIQIDARFVAAAVPVTGLILVVHMLCGSLMTDPSSTAHPPELDDDLPGERA